MMESDATRLATRLLRKNIISITRNAETSLTKPEVSQIAIAAILVDYANYNDN